MASGRGALSPPPTTDRVTAATTTASATTRNKNMYIAEVPTLWCRHERADAEVRKLKLSGSDRAMRV
ncbi:hypothetical protein GCM10023335_47530 [Streptomyces siamensis]|uniref:Uncharacterized protein n=1 Tax=Streptomyces siamensis TaxID=1274986 RepID=A0ABP9J365_9ACTN